MLLQGFRTPSRPPRSLNLRQVSHKEASRAAVAARGSCRLVSWPDYDSSKLGQFFNGDAVGVLRAMQSQGQQAAAHSAGLALALANPSGWHMVICPLLWPPWLWWGISAGPCKALGVQMGHLGSQDHYSCNTFIFPLNSTYVT